MTAPMQEAVERTVATLDEYQKRSLSAFTAQQAQTGFRTKNRTLIEHCSAVMKALRG